MRLTLEPGQLGPDLRLPLSIHSISPSGLVVLTADKAPSGLNEGLFGERAQESGPLTFLFEKDGQCVTLQASLLWVELSNEGAEEPHLELIVDTGDEPGWQEVHAALEKE